MNLPGFTAEFSLYGRTAGRPHMRPGLCGEQYGVIPQMTLVNVLCAEDICSYAWSGVASPYCQSGLLRMHVQEHLLRVRRAALCAEDV